MTIAVLGIVGPSHVPKEPVEDPRMTDIVFGCHSLLPDYLDLVSDFGLEGTKYAKKTKCIRDDNILVRLSNLKNTAVCRERLLNDITKSIPQWKNVSEVNSEVVLVNRDWLADRNQGCSSPLVDILVSLGWDPVNIGDCGERKGFRMYTILMPFSSSSKAVKGSEAYDPRERGMFPLPTGLSFSDIFSDNLMSFARSLKESFAALNEGDWLIIECSLPPHHPMLFFLLSKLDPLFRQVRLQGGGNEWLGCWMIGIDLKRPSLKSEWFFVHGFLASYVRECDDIVAWTLNTSEAEIVLKQHSSDFLRLFRQAAHKINKVLKGSSDEKSSSDTESIISQSVTGSVSSVINAMEIPKQTTISDQPEYIPAEIVHPILLSESDPADVLIPKSMTLEGSMTEDPIPVIKERTFSVIKTLAKSDDSRKFEKIKQPGIQPQLLSSKLKVNTNETRPFSEPSHSSNPIKNKCNIYSVKRQKEKIKHSTNNPQPIRHTKKSLYMVSRNEINSNEPSQPELAIRKVRVENRISCSQWDPSPLAIYDRMTVCSYSIPITCEKARSVKVKSSYDFVLKKSYPPVCPIVRERDLILRNEDYDVSDHELLNDHD